MRSWALISLVLLALYIPASFYRAGFSSNAQQYAKLLSLLESKMFCDLK